MNGELEGIASNIINEGIMDFFKKKKEPEVTSEPNETKYKPTINDTLQTIQRSADKNKPLDKFELWFKKFVQDIKQNQEIDEQAVVELLSGYINTVNERCEYVFKQSVNQIATAYYNTKYNEEWDGRTSIQDDERRADVLDFIYKFKLIFDIERNREIMIQVDTFRTYLKSTGKAWVSKGWKGIIENRKSMEYQHDIQKMKQEVYQNKKFLDIGVDFTIIKMGLVGSLMNGKTKLVQEKKKAVKKLTKKQERLLIEGLRDFFGLRKRGEEPQQVKLAFNIGANLIETGDSRVNADIIKSLKEKVVQNNQKIRNGSVGSADEMSKLRYDQLNCITRIHQLYEAQKLPTILVATYKKYSKNPNSETERKFLENIDIIQQKINTPSTVIYDIEEILKKLELEDEQKTFFMNMSNDISFVLDYYKSYQEQKCDESLMRVVEKLGETDDYTYKAIKEAMKTGRYELPDKSKVDQIIKKYTDMGIDCSGLQFSVVNYP